MSTDYFLKISGIITITKNLSINFIGNKKNNFFTEKDHISFAETPKERFKYIFV